MRAFSPFKPCIVGEWSWYYVMEIYTLWREKIAMKYEYEVGNWVTGMLKEP